MSLKILQITMTNVYNNILQSKLEKQKLLAILIDPDKIDLKNLRLIIEKINQSPATDVLDELVLKIKQKCNLPIVLFPGNPSQISGKADAILFLNLISGRNPDYLIEHQVNAVPFLKKTNLEIIATGYILVESGKPTAVERVSITKPLDGNNPEYILQTAQAGEMMGNKLVYLEAGSGADFAIPKEIITLVAQNIQIPLIVGGGIRSLSGIDQAYDAGADLVVIGTAFENNLDFFNQQI
jgi:phosphoglycerol geranylgeranyltransferase